MSDDSDFVRDVLPKLVERKGSSLAEASLAIGRNQAYLQQFIKKGSPRVLAEEDRSKLAAFLDIDEDVLKPAGAKAALSFRAPSSLTIANQSYMPIPVYDIRASAGAGALVEDGQPTAHQVFRDNFIRRLSNAPIEKLAVIQVSGDSMWETLHDGDTVLVDRSVDKIVKDGIYILAFDGELLVKRCQRDLSDGSVIVMSDNPKYQSFKVSEADRLRVLGRAIWIGRALG